MFAVRLDGRSRGQQLLLRNRVSRDVVVRRGSPSVSVPVLSTTSVFTFSIRSIAPASFMSTPACAPRPTPTMIDIGVASPSGTGKR